jgi:hypothetical protein
MSNSQNTTYPTGNSTTKQKRNWTLAKQYSSHIVLWLVWLLALASLSILWFAPELVIIGK